MSLAVAGGGGEDAVGVYWSTGRQGGSRDTSATDLIRRPPEARKAQIQKEADKNEEIKRETK